jgi:hypothetical protein
MPEPLGWNKKVPRDKPYDFRETAPVHVYRCLHQQSFTGVTAATGSTCVMVVDAMELALFSLASLQAHHELFEPHHRSSLPLSVMYRAAS